MSNSNAYTPPNPDPVQSSNSERRWKRARRISILMMPLAVVAGVGSTVIGMIRSFQSIATTSKTPEPAQLADHIAESLLLGLIALPVFGIFFVVFILANIKLARVRRRKARNAQ